MKPIVILGVIVALLGVLALAIPEFTTNDTKNVVTLGDLKVQATCRLLIACHRFWAEPRLSSAW